MIINTVIILMALAMSLTFFGKSIIGISMGIATLVSFFIIFQNRQEIFAKEKITAFIFSKEIIFIFIMICIWFVSSMFGIDPPRSIEKIVEILGLIIGGMAIFIAIKSSKSYDYKLFSRVIIIVAGVCSLLVALTPFIGDFAFSWSRSYGSVLALLFPIAFVAAISSKQYRHVMWVCLLLITMGVFASGGRTAWVGFLFSFILCLSFVPWSIVSDKIRVMSILLVLIGVGVGLGSQYASNTTGEDTFIDRIEAMKSMDRPASGRLETWSNVIERIEQRPLLGYGIKSTQLLNIEKSKGEHVLHTHNAILEIQLETGVFGLTAFILTVLLFVKNFLSAYIKSTNKKLKLQSLPIFISCITYGVCSMALTSIFHTWWFLYLIALLIFLKLSELKLHQ